MTSYRYYSTINIEDKTAAKEKNKRLFLDILSRLREYFYPLAAKEKKSVNNQKFLQGNARKEQSAERKANNTIDAVRQAPSAMRLSPGRRRQNQKEEETCHY
jgi:hypothetical protein